MDEKKRGVAYQSKDIMSKVLTEELKGKSFEAYGVNLPRIVDSRPTDLAAVEANELRLDRLFKLEDESYLIVDYESDYSEEKKSKYLGYVARLAKMLYNSLKKYPVIRVLIVYTADVTRRQTVSYLNLGSVTLHVEEAFLSELDPEALWRKARAQIDSNGRLEDLELMRLIIYPLTFRKKADKQGAIQRAIGIIDRIVPEKQRVFVLKGLLVFCDKVILDEDAEKIRRMLMLTKVEQIIEKEKQEAVEEATRKVAKSVTESVTESVTVKVTESVTKTVTDRIAMNFLGDGLSPESVAKNTGLTLDYVQKLASHA